MSTTVDQRVVEMRFDNKQFENNVSTTMSTLEKFKRALKLDGASKGLDDVSNSARRLDLSGLTTAAETVTAKFSYMQMSIQHQLNRIVDSAFNAGKRIVSALTIDPIKTGLSEYETQMNAVQTILANTESKGSTLDDVNNALDTLNTYADKTIYNFTEMTRNIGTFTAAGVDLDTSVNAIQGIANLAAVSGSNSQQASTAMYQLSQAMASGTVKLMDWNSVVNAGMGGQVFQDALKETARVHGVKVDEMIKKHGSFRESLSEGWITTDILTETLSHFTMAAEEGSEEWNNYKKSLMDSGYSEEQALNILKLSNTATDAATKVKTATQLFDTLKETAQSGWTQTWEILLGDFEEAKELFSNLYATLAPILEASAKARNELLQGWKDAGGRTHLIDSLYNIFEGIGNIVKPIKEAFREIFPATTVKQLVSFTEGLKNLTERFKEFFAEGSDNAKNLKTTFKGLFAAIDIVKQAFGAVFRIIKPLFGEFGNLSGGILGVTAKMGNWIIRLRESIRQGDFFGQVVEKVQTALQKVANFFKPVIDGIKEFGSAISSTFTDISDNAGERLGPLTTLGNFIKNVFVSIGKAVEKVFPYISAAATGIGNVLKSLMDQISSAVSGADYSKVFDIANGGIFAAIGVAIAKFMNSGADIISKSKGLVENIGDVLEGAGDALGAFTDSLKADTLKKIATAIAILAASLFVLSIIDSEKLTGALGAITVLFIELMTAMDIFSKMGDMKGVVKIAGSIVALSAALLVLSLALKIMSTMSWSEMGVGLISLTVGLGALVGAVNLLPEKKVKGAAKAIKTMSSAILILAVGIKIMSTMSWEEMGIGLISMVVGLGALVGAVNLLPKDTALRAAGMIGLATAMVILGAALKIMASMSWGEIAKSLVALAGSLLILSVAMTLMIAALPGAAAMLVVAPALVVLAGALRLMSGISWGEVAKGLITLGGSLLIIAGAMALMKTALPGAAALLVVAASLAVLTPVLMALGSMSLAEIGKSLLMLAGVFTVFGLAALVLKPLVPTMLALAGALALLGVACAAIGAGVLMVGAGITALAAALAAGGLAITVFVSSLIGLIPYLMEQIGIGIIKVCEVIAGGAAAFCDAFAVIIVALVDALVASVPKIVEGVLVLVEELLKSLAAHTPMIVTYLFDFIIGIIDAIATKLPDLIQAGVNLIMALFQGIIDALKSVDPMVLVNGILAVGMLTALMAALAACAALAPAAMTGVLGAGVVIAELAALLAVMGGLAQIPGLEWLISEGGGFLQTVGTAIGQFLGGIVGGFAIGTSAALPQIGADLSEFMYNARIFIEGAKSIDASAMEGVKSLVGIIAAITAVDVMNGLTSWITGGSSITEFATDLVMLGYAVKQYANAVSGIDAEAVTASAAAAQAIAEMTSHIPNSGGVVAWFTGDNSISKFSTDLVKLGYGLKHYSDAISGFNAEAVTASANAATAIADMTSHIPNSGGVVSWFTGDNSISKFGGELVVLGTSLAAYSTAISGFNAEAVIASASAAQALVDMTSKIPNQGGMVAWFTGENSVASWGIQLVTLGASLKAYSLAIGGFNAEAVIASANAATALVDMTNKIPNEGGMVAWFTGESSIARFGTELISLGTGLKGFSDKVAGINVESATAAAGVAKTLAEMASYIPNEGGVTSWFAGDNSIAKFSGNLTSLGKGLKGFSDEIAGMNAENVTAAANAAKALAQMASYIPNEGGMAAWFKGENSVASFGGKLPTLGKGLKGFSDAVAGIVPENVTAAANAAKSLAQMADTAPKNSSKIIKFGENLEKFGGKLKSYFSKMSEVSSDTISSATNAIKAVKDASSGLDANSFSSASKAIDELVKSINKMSKVKASAADGFSSAVKKLAETNVDSMIKAFKNAGTDMKNAGKDLMAKFIDGVEAQNSKVNKAGKTAIEKFIDGIEASESKAKKASKSLVTGCSTAISDMSSKFKSAGKDLGSGLVQGINAKQTAVYNAAYKLGQKAVQGEKDGQKSNSPSKLTILAGNWLGEGLIIGMEQMGRKVYNAGSDLGATASGTISSAIAKISSTIYDDIDTQPTIRPVLDLSDVKSGASALNGMLSSGSIGVRANLGAISSMMSVRGQNGSNSDVVSELAKLRKDIGNLSNTTYQVNGVTYDDGSNVSDAIATIVRAARIERRV